MNDLVIDEEVFLNNQVFNYSYCFLVFDENTLKINLHLS